MPSPESLNINSVPATGEVTNATPRQTYEVRGRTTVKAEMARREKELLEERARIEAELRETEARVARTRQELGLQNSPQQETGPTPAPATEATPTPTGGAAGVNGISETGGSGGTSGNGATNGANGTSEAGVSGPEVQPSPEEVRDTIKKAKKNSTLKKVLAGAAIIALAALSWVGIKSAINNNQPTTPEQPSTASTAGETQAVGENQEAKGIYDGYGEKGMWLSQAKGGQYDFASAKEAAEVCDNDECEILKYTARNQVESYADYLANLPEALQPEGFKGLTILETEKKLESLSDEEYAAVKQQFDNIIDSALTRDVTLNGNYHNAYMQLGNPSKSATHSNMELVQCTTNENGTKATEFYWTTDGTANGQIVGSMTAKISRSGGSETEAPTIDGGCTQIVTRTESATNLYNGMKSITENPVSRSTEAPTEGSAEIPTEGSTETPTEKPTETPTTADRGKTSNTHAGDHQQQMGTTENTKGDKEREGTKNNSAANANPGSEVTNNIIEQEHGKSNAAPGSEAIIGNQGVTVNGSPLVDSNSGEQVVREGRGGPATIEEILAAAEGVASTYSSLETNADHSGAITADNANVIQQETIDTSNQRGAGANVDRSQADLANIVNGGGQ